MSLIIRSIIFLEIYPANPPMIPRIKASDMLWVDSIPVVIPITDSSVPDADDMSLSFIGNF